MSDRKKVDLINGNGELVYPVIDPNEVGGGSKTTYLFFSSEDDSSNFPKIMKYVGGSTLEEMFEEVASTDEIFTEFNNWVDNIDSTPISDFNALTNALNAIQNIKFIDMATMMEGPCPSYIVASNLQYKLIDISTSKDDDMIKSGFSFKVKNTNDNFSFYVFTSDFESWQEE